MASEPAQDRITAIDLEPLSDQIDAGQETLDNEPPTSYRVLIKLGSAGLSFFCAGMNDGSLGALIPYVIRSYSVNTDLVSVVYGAAFAGWLLTAIINTHLCQHFDLGVMLAMGAALQLIAQVLRSWQPPFPLFAVTFFLQSFGMALQDTHSNTFVASVKTAHRWLGFIHAMYALGCCIGPLVATPIASAAHPSRWYLFYTCLVGVGTINLILVLVAFRDSLIFKQCPSTVQQAESRKPTAFTEISNTLRSAGVWLLSLYFFFYLGTVITASVADDIGWVVEYLVQVRDANVSDMGYVQVGFAGGTFLGRALLAEPTKRLGERRMIFIYAVLCLGLELLFWLVPNIVAAAVAIALFGFFSGPFFATGVSLGSQILPKEIRSSGLAFVFMMGQVGGSIFPAITGLIASRAGIKVLQPMVVGLCSATAVIWLLVPRPNLHRD
ncbi:hypothetical protein H2198_001254 [Neophaeococcomyces mojaviensis]|uniref:Uncharacterized protein n=1 Tax=Neophaeococcomyces mojaviensis TaxID=3383035 RepID=A0ACC3AHT4_9EURO|nr:hypothetical protein H2198_001254 [Knufia sp. JES_112]